MGMSAVTRKYDILIHSPCYGDRSCDSLARADYSSKQVLAE